MSSTTSLDPQPKLRLFESPLAHERRARVSPNPSPKAPTFTISGPTDLANHNASKERKESMPNIYDEREHRDAFDRQDDSHMRETPEFKRYEEATNIELFYDLFFVANLTTFTDVHDINDISALKAYAGFFCILWFLWAQVALFDVRFVQDSILERVGKGLQFGVMVGLAIVGPDFNPNKQEQDVFRSLAIILMISRIVLGFQYSVVLREVWYYKDTKFPLALLVGGNFVAAFVYFGTFFGFKPNTPHSNVFVVWYITAVLETIVNIAVSSRWEVLTFAGTHLIKRMSLLTLIILGEGIIALSKSIATITEQEDSLTSTLLLTIISAVIIIYFIYMIYFDWLNSSHFGSFREGLWAFLHFPFHLALVLLMEGAAQFILWRKVVEVVADVNKLFLASESTFPSDSTSSPLLSSILGNTTNQVFNSFPPNEPHTIDQAQSALSLIGNAAFNTTSQLNAIGTLFAVISDSLFDNFGIDPPSPEGTGAGLMEMMPGEMDDPNAVFSRNQDAFRLVFIYFFISSGLTLLLLNALQSISRPSPPSEAQSKLTWKDSMKRYLTPTTILTFIIALGQLAVASIVNTTNGIEFAQSVWILPSVGLAFVLVVALGYVSWLR
ncbi:uncharacterized protein PAC_12499 [Phialocephala subalpina]|uniref:Low temperature requirement protein A n=1 Tax=Phialocephala subalpina TaxID=576137 RepID=A0A1L7XC56_9HELO|nr:uncharacterized protein PAC_12499 [Phialocephala subalpina]